MTTLFVYVVKKKFYISSGRCVMGVKDLDINQGTTKSKVTLTCKCGDVIKIKDNSPERLQLALRNLDVHFEGMCISLYDVCGCTWFGKDVQRIIFQI